MLIERSKNDNGASFAANPQALRPPATARQRRRLFIITALILVIIAAAFTGYRIFVQQMMKARLGAPRPPAPVEAVMASVQAVPKYLSAVGTLQAVHQITVAAELGGRIVTIHFEPGAQVKTGDSLVQLNDATERADLSNFQSQARLANVNLDRTKKLSARDFQSRQSVDEQQALLDQAQAGIARAEAQIAQKLIRAPFDGVLGVRQVDLGGYVNSGGPIVTLTDLSKLWINFTLPEQRATDIQTGQDVRLRVDAFPDRVFTAKVTAIEPQISAQTRTILVQGTLDNPDGVLMPGMFAKVEVVLPELPDAIVVPETAVDFDLYGDSVFVIQPSGEDKGGKPQLRASRVHVKTGTRFDGKVVVTSGLKGNEQLVASGQVRLSNGAPVAVVPGDSLAHPPSTKTY